MIVKAKLKDANRLTALAISSKSYWGYSNELIKTWEDDLKVTSKMIEEPHVFNFMIDEEIRGFYILNLPIENNIELEFLFIDPVFIGKGVGKTLLMSAFKKAISLGCTTIKILSDPNATSFYEKQGFKTIDKKESTIPNRFLPIMEKDLSDFPS